MDTAWKNFIGGAWLDARSDRTDPVIDPATGEVITEVASSNEADVAAAVEAAAAAFDEWAATAPGERAKALSALADRLEERADDLVAIESRNVGKPISAVPDEIGFLVDNLRYFAAGARNLTTQAPGEYLAGYTSILRREPLGVVALDRPVELPADDGGAGRSGPALAAGNTVVLKPSELTPLTALELADIAVRPLPAGGAQRDHRRRRALRGGARGPSQGRHRVADRRSDDGQGDHARRSRDVEAGASRARWKGTCGRVRRRRPRSRCRRREALRVLQRGAGLHRGDTCDHRTGHLRRLRERARRCGEEPQRREPCRPGHRARAGRLRRAARPGSGLRRSCEGCRRDRRDRWRGRVRCRVLLRAECDHGRRAGRRDHPAGGVRSRGHRAALHGRRARRSRGRTASTTASQRACGPATSDERCV